MSPEAKGFDSKITLCGRRLILRSTGLRKARMILASSRVPEDADVT